MPCLLLLLVSPLGQECEVLPALKSITLIYGPFTPLHDIVNKDICSYLYWIRTISDNSGYSITGQLSYVSYTIQVALTDKMDFKNIGIVWPEI